jgi:hypothetical protein
MTIVIMIRMVLFGAQQEEIIDRIVSFFVVLLLNVLNFHTLNSWVDAELFTSLWYAKTPVPLIPIQAVEKLEQV